MITGPGGLLPERLSQICRAPAFFGTISPTGRKRDRACPATTSRMSRSISN